MEQIDKVVQALPSASSDRTILLGGDFNVAQGDRVFQAIDTRLRDSFATGGRGWCNTIMHSMPLLRIDQIWASIDLHAHDAHVAEAANTDHLMYVAAFSQAPPYGKVDK